MKILSALNALMLALTFLLAGCAGETETPIPVATPNLEATIQAAVATALPTATPTPAPDIDATVTAGIASTQAAAPTQNANTTPDTGHRRYRRGRNGSHHRRHAPAHKYTNSNRNSHPHHISGSAVEQDAQAGKARGSKTRSWSRKLDPGPYLKPRAGPDTSLQIITSWKDMGRLVSP